ncbi:TadE/TadG family type IV pilus assembly protein [Altererythrobacter sp.]|uniref:TadE/TadG family type IV pilus assembly protein n=1 Tax=Altererythrobacter sp. TaxID=1872480 RepID=UPI003D01E3DA
MTVTITRMFKDESGLAAEFALVLPLLLLLVLGTFDVGIYAWRLNQAEKATQIGARWVAVTDPLATEIATTSYVNTSVGGVLIEQGDRIPVGALGKITCTSSGCTCTTSPCPGTTYDSAAFGRLSARMKQILPSIQDSNIVVEYSGSGLGYAGDPNGPDIAPLITVRLQNMTYNSVVLSPIGSVGLPDFAYSLTAEDLSCVDPDVCYSN